MAYDNNKNNDITVRHRLQTDCIRFLIQVEQSGKRKRLFEITRAR